MKNKGSSGSGGGGNRAPEPEPDEFVGGAEAPSIPEDAGLASEAPPAGEFAGATPATPGERTRVEGKWTCATCGGDITSLPFTPRDSSNLKCIDCFKASKA